MDFVSAVVDWYKLALSRFADFGGRSRRTEFFCFWVTNGVVEGALNWLGRGSWVFRLIAALYGLMIFLPSLAVQIRRLHDTGRSGWWLLIYLIPVIGWIWLLVLMATDSDRRTNIYGPSPKA